MLEKTKIYVIITYALMKEGEVVWRKIPMHINL